MNPHLKTAVSRPVAVSLSGRRLSFILLTGLATGSSVVLTRLGLSEIPPLTLVTLRLAVASLFFAVTLSLLRRPIPRQPRLLFDIALAGINNVGFPIVVFTLALQYISSGVLTIFLALVPLVTSLMAHLWLSEERLNPTRLIGLLVAFAGVVLLLATRTTGLSEQAGGDIRGHLLSLCGVLAVGFATVYTRRRLQSADVLTVTAGQMVVGLLAVAPFALALNSFEFGAVTWRGWFVVGYSGIVGSFLAFLLFLTLIKQFGATTAALAGYVMPIISVGLGAVLLGELITVPLVIGAAITLLGVFLSNRAL